MTDNGNGSRQDSCEQNLNDLPPHERIRVLNDRFRQTGQGGTIIITRGIEALKPYIKHRIIQAIKGIDKFTPDNDAYGLHDFGSVKIETYVVFWKIDCYDLDLIGRSPDESDPAVTRRIMTIMLAEEY